MRRVRMSAVGQYLPKSDVCVTSIQPIIADVAASRIRADFVAEVRCSLFWPVIPLL